MSRSRSAGSSTAKSYIGRYYDIFVKKVSAPGGYSLQYRRADYSMPWAYVYDDRQTMTDVIDMGPGHYNPVTHVKRHKIPVYVRGAYSAPAINPNNLPWNSEVRWTQDRTWLMEEITPSGLVYNGTLLTPSIPQADWASLVDQVGSQLDGRMQVGQNLITSLVQVSQTVGMVKNPLNLKRLPRLLRSKPLGALSRGIASSYLEYQFGWKNLWRDVKQLACVFQEVSNHRDYLMETVNKFVSLSARQTSRVLNPSVGTFASIGSNPSYILLRPSCTDAENVYCFSLDLRRTEAALAWSKLDQVFARLGANDVASALWDLVPYSFVVDWFTHLNRMLEQGPVSWQKYDLRRIGYSIKTVWHVKFRVTSTASSQIDGKVISVDYYTEPGVAQTAYTRFPGFPDGTSSVGIFGDLNKTQIAEGLALIIQRL